MSAPIPFAELKRKIETEMGRPFQSVPQDIELSRLKMRRMRRFTYAVKRFDLVSFDHIADWCARDTGSVDRNEGRRVQALCDLEDAIVRGEFGPPDKPAVAYLPKIVPLDRRGRFPLRLTAGQLLFLSGSGMSYASDLWAPRALCLRWMDDRGVRPPRWLMAAPPAKTRQRKPGRPGGKTEAMIAQMRAMDRDELARMKQIEMAHTFGAAASTCREARKKALGR